MTEKQIALLNNLQTSFNQESEYNRFSSQSGTIDAQISNEINQKLLQLLDILLDNK